jgi:4-hydroxy-2-oxoheptanedioate aldolase
MRENRLKRKLQAGEFVLGPFMIGTHPSFIEICGMAGFDFAIVDMEHGALSTDAAENLCRAAQGVDLTPIVRVRKNDGPQIQQALDIGSGGVQIPQIETQADAEAAVRGAKYRPIGLRGLSFYTRAADYTVFGMPGYTDHLNAEQLLVVHVEGVRGAENLEQILTVPHIDVIFLGPYDLSQSLGIPGQVRDPRVIDLMRKCATKIRAAGKAVGTFTDNPEVAKEWIDVGVQYVSMSVDVGIFARACERLVKAVRG